ncbi:hypothetical protein FS749_015765 [Ceratobasidium sp. UAMH 11750]|nr:hypothetical protein FS749_015765 [Ceratobasidium sp. UAMH 11750]
MTLASFFHFAVIRQQNLTPSTAFTVLAVFNELRYAMSTFPETIINILQSMVSAKRIEKYMASAEISDIQSIEEAALDPTIKLVSASVSWPQQTLPSSSVSSTPFTPHTRFTISDLSAEFPTGELSLICGKIGSGKSLLLLALLGEAEVLARQVIAPKSPPDTLAHLNTQVDLNDSNWIIQGVCAYVPQTAWLQNDSIQNNILFGLPMNRERYRKTLEACALTADLAIIEDGDQAEIGEQGVNLSGGQKARVSLARAIYSRASVLFLDDILSAVDAQTTSHLFERCLRGPLSHNRSIVLVSHHVQLVLPGASYVVALDNGRVLFSGSQAQFASSSVMQDITYSFKAEDPNEGKQKLNRHEGHDQKHTEVENLDPFVDTTGDLPSGQELQAAPTQNAPRKLIEDEARAVGRVNRKIWTAYLSACGSYVYWTIFSIVMLGGALAPVLTNGWLRYWSAHSGEPDTRGPLWFITIYALISLSGMFMQTLRWYVVYDGSIRASTVLTFVAVTYVGGVRFAAAALVVAAISYNVAKVYGQTSRDLRRLDSITRSPLYSIYGEAIAGVAVIRAFGASTIFLREMFRRVDTNASPYHGSWSVNRWVSLRFNMVAVAIVTLSATATMLDKSIDASFAGFAISMAVGITYDVILFVRRFVGLEQSMIALERTEEFSILPREGPEVVEPRPRETWPESGQIVVEGLVVRYAPDLPKVLHGLDFEIPAGSKSGVLGRTGGGKSTLASSFFRFVEAAEGRIIIDGVDISQLGLSDLRSRVTIIPQDPTILSGTIRSTLDIFDQYKDHEIFEALRRVHLLPSSEEPLHEMGENINLFRDLDSPVGEGGENFSAGEKQLMCMARAILKHSKVLVCDEATASVDYVTDELISQTIRKEFVDSTIIAIAHRLRTIIDYDKVIVLDQGRIAEYDEPSKLLTDPASKFHALCKASGTRQFAILKQMAEEAARTRRE